MQFDFIVGNPPYEYKGAGTLHLRIMNTALKFCTDKLVFIMPSAPITKQLNDYWYNMFKNAVCNRVEVMDKGVFKGTNMDNTAIFYCDRNDKPENYCKKLDVDKAIYYAIDDEGHRLFMDRIGKFGMLKLHSNLHDATKQSRDRAKRSIVDGYYLNVNRAGIKPGQGETQWLSGTLQKIGVLDKEGELLFLEKREEVMNIIRYSNIEYCENLKNLMVDGLVLRYGLWLTQTNQNIYQAQLKYIPDLDYTTIDTDEGILRECGFTEDEIEKMMEYLNNFDFSQNRNDMIRDFEKK